MLSLLDSPPQSVAGDWSSLYAAQEPVKEQRHELVVPVPVPMPPPPPAKKPAYGGGRRIKNLEMCTEALGCETGGVDGAVTAADVVVAAAAAEYAMAVETDGAERKRRAREEAVAESMTMELEAGRGRRTGRRGGALPPPLTTLVRGGSRLRMVHERRDGRLAVYAVRTARVQAERCGGRLRLRLVPCAGCSNAAECHKKEKKLIKQEAEEAAIVRKEEHDADEATTEEEYGGVAKYVRGGRCVEAEVAATAAARRGKNWEPEQAAPFWVATS